MSAPSPNSGEPHAHKCSKSEGDESKKRRWQSRSDEEIADEMDNRNLSYRKGWPQLPPLPVSTIRDGANNKVNDPVAVMEAVISLCQAQNVDIRDIYFAFRVPAVQEQDEDYHTLVVAADLSKDPLTHSLIIQIRKHLQQDPRHEEIFIEIIDHRAVYGLYSFAIPPSEEHLLDVWEQVFDMALQEICKHKERWTTIEMLYRGLENSAARCSATVVVTSPTAAKNVWIRLILPNIHNRILAVSLFLKVELLCGSSLQIASQGKASDAQYYQKWVPMGASIGRQDLQSHSGTAGGVVKLSNGMVYALTNHGVVRNNDLDKLLLEKQGNSSEPLFLEPGNHKFDYNKNRFTCPSIQDHNAFIQERESEEKYWMNMPTYFEAATQQLAAARSQLQQARTTDLAFGTVAASSGLRTVKSEIFSSDPATGERAAETGKSKFRFILDWSLLDFHSEREMINRLPVFPFKTPMESYLTPVLLCSKWTTMNNPKCHVMRDEVKVGKMGRTTGLTYGIVNAIPTIINPNIDKGEYEPMSDTYSLTVKDCSSCMSFYSPAGKVVEKGDSGSIVLHVPSGHWLGLLFGETSTKAALFTPIELVLRDIEEVTGHKVVEPAFIDTW